MPRQVGHLLPAPNTCCDSLVSAWVASSYQVYEAAHLPSSGPSAAPPSLYVFYIYPTQYCTDCFVRCQDTDTQLATSAPPRIMTKAPSRSERRFPSPRKSHAQRTVKTALSLKSAVT